MRTKSPWIGNSFPFELYRDPTPSEGQGLWKHTTPIYVTAYMTLEEAIDAARKKAAEGNLTYRIIKKEYHDIVEITAKVSLTEDWRSAQGWV